MSQPEDQMPEAIPTYGAPHQQDHRQYQHGATHHRKAQDHRRPAAHPVGIGADHDGADRPRDEPGAERRQ